MNVATRPPLRGVRHVALVVRDLDAAERFWTEVMGYAVEWRPDADNVYLSSGSDNIALHRLAPGLLPPGGEGTEPQEAFAERQQQRLDHIGLAVPARDDVDAWAAHLAGHGVPLQAAPRTHRDGSRSLYFHSADGTLVQIIYHGPLSQ